MFDPGGLFSDIPLDFHEQIYWMLLKNSVYLLAYINTKKFRNTPEEEYFAHLRILYPFIKSFVNPLADINPTFSDSSSSSISTNVYVVIFLSIFSSLVLKSLVLNQQYHL